MPEPFPAQLQYHALVLRFKGLNGMMIVHGGFHWGRETTTLWNYRGVERGVVDWLVRSPECLPVRARAILRARNGKPHGLPAPCNRSSSIFLARLLSSRNGPCILRWR